MRGAYFFESRFGRHCLCLRQVTWLPPAKSDESTRAAPGTALAAFAPASCAISPKKASRTTSVHSLALLSLPLFAPFHLPPPPRFGLNLGGGWGGTPLISPPALTAQFRLWLPLHRVQLPALCRPVRVEQLPLLRFAPELEAFHLSHNQNRFGILKNQEGGRSCSWLGLSLANLHLPGF